MVKAVPDSVPMNGGDGTYSYAKNSYVQRECANLAMENIREMIAEKLDVKSLSSVSNTIRITDLGCSVGPNTFIAVQNILEAIQQKYRTQCPTSQMPEFQVFFNDQALNDFNTLFSSLPQGRQYFAAGVPGSFHYRLFPESSIHFVYTSYAFNWLSKVPKELLDRNSPAWNKGRIHYSGAPDEVVNAYAMQFAKDMENILNARAKEIVAGGMMVIIMPSIQRRKRFSQLPNGLIFDIMASTLMDMVNAGIISEDQVDSFNLPMYSASPEEMVSLVERNGYFNIVKMEPTNPSSWVKGPLNIRECIGNLRSSMEGTFAKHFDSVVVNEMFDRLSKKFSDCLNQMESRNNEGAQLLVVLQRK